MDGLLLDVSGNGGGSLTDAVRLAGLFFKTGNVVKQSSRSSKIKPIPLKDKDEEVDWSGPLVILTSRVSASGFGNCCRCFKRLQKSCYCGIRPHLWKRNSPAGGGITPRA